jgi:hypothetical protein
MGEIGIRWDVRRRDSGIEAIMFSLFFIPDRREESLEVGELLQVSEEFQKEEADGVIGMPSYGRIS